MVDVLYVAEVVCEAVCCDAPRCVSLPPPPPPPRWNGGSNHLIFSMIPGAHPSFLETPSFYYGKVCYIIIFLCFPSPENNSSIAPSLSMAHVCTLDSRTAGGVF